MSEMTTQRILELLEYGANEADECYPNRTMQGDDYRTIAARLKALEKMRREIERFCVLAEKQILAPRAETKGFGSLSKVVYQLRAILDTAREGS